MQEELFNEPGFELGDVEQWCLEQGCRFVVGVDEAGRGPLAGPVYAAAVVLDLMLLEEAWILSLNDSKKLTPAARKKAQVLIQSNAVGYAVCHRDASQIDSINILQATLRAMEDAVSEVVSDLDIDQVLIDGNQQIETELAQRTLVKGDGRSLAIAAASVLAKVGRDELMLAYDEQWPEYGFASNKGYGSRMHREAIVAHGPCSIHRMTFGGVREYAHLLRED